MSALNKIGVVGATGAVGRELLKILEERQFPAQELVPFSSPRSKGRPIPFHGKEVACRVLEPGCFAGIDIVFFDVDDPLAKEWVPQAVESGAWVVDNSAAFRMEKDVLLLVPEVNGSRLDELLGQKKITPRQRILANPNCSTAPLVMVLKALDEKYGVKRAVVSTYQSTSGAGWRAVEELCEQSAAYLEGKKSVKPENFAHQIAFNCLPQVGGFGDDLYTSEERKMIDETRKMLDRPDLAVTATAVRVPTLYCHGESINVELDQACSAEEARSVLGSFPGIEVIDRPEDLVYPLAFSEREELIPAGTGKDPVYVGRVRKDDTVQSGLNLWLVSDNLRKGAALNAAQIGELLVQKAFSS